MSTKETISEFFARVLPANKSAERVELKHKQQIKGDGPVIMSWEIDHAERAKLADEVEDTAAKDAACHHGMQVYTVALVDGKRFGLALYTMRVQGSEDEHDDERMETTLSMSSEPANATGLVAQAKRHTEAAWRATASMVDRMDKRSEREINRLTEKCEKYEKEYLRLLDLYSKLVMGDREHEQSLAEQKRKEVMQDRVASRLLPVLSAVITKVVGNGGTSEDPLLLAIEDGMSDWTYDDIMAMSEGLKEDGKKVAFMQMVKVLAERQQERKKKEEAEKTTAAAAE